MIVRGQPPSAVLLAQRGVLEAASVRWWPFFCGRGDFEVIVPSLAGLACSGTLTRTYVPGYDIPPLRGSVSMPFMRSLRPLLCGGI